MRKNKVSDRTHIILSQPPECWSAALSGPAKCFLLIIGIYASFKLVLASFSIEADTAHSLILWHGINKHGIAWLKDWLFTQDNWLLSLVPLHFILFSLLGDNPAIPIILGWIIFIAAAAASATLARICGAKRSYLWVFLFLINLGIYAHQNGFISYSTSHNISNLYGLLALLLYTKFLGQPTGVKLVSFSLLLTAGAVSDPWLLAAYNVPILIANIILLLLPRATIPRTVTFQSTVAVSISVLAVKTKLFGAFQFLPLTHFHPGNWQIINSNAVYLLKDLGGLFNFIPFHTSNDFLPGIITVTLLSLCVLRIAPRPLVTLLNLGSTKAILLLIFALSSCSIVSAFVLSDVPAQDYSARFLINILYAVPVIFAIYIEENWKKLSINTKILTVTIISLSFLSNISSTIKIALDGDLKIKSEDVERTISFLRDHDLNYGYGPYWGANANAVTVKSGYKIIIRPVTFSSSSGAMVIGNRMQSSKRWEKDEDFPKSAKKFFVIVKSDGEECPIVETCLSGLQKQYGKPVQKLTMRDSVVLVWNRESLINAGHQIRFTPGNTYFFGEGGELINGHGWSHPESWGIWSDGQEASIRFELQKTLEQDIFLSIGGKAFLHKDRASRQVDLYCNNAYIGTLEYNNSDRELFQNFHVNKDIINSNGKYINISFRISEPESPHDLEISNDTRKLGFGLSHIKFSEQNGKNPLPIE